MSAGSGRSSPRRTLSSWSQDDVEGVVAFGDLLTGETAEASLFSLILPLGLAVGVVSVSLHEVLKMLDGQGRALAEVGHVGAHIVDPDFFCVSLVLLSAGKKQDVRLDALGVKDARRQAQDGVEVALVHQVGPDLLAVAVGKEHVVGQDHGGSGFAGCAKRAVDHLQKIELLVGRGIGQVIPGRSFAAALGAEGRIGQDHVIVPELLAFGGKGIRLKDSPFDAVEHGVHQGQAVSVRHQLDAGEGLFLLEFLSLCCLIEVVVMLLLQILVGGDHETEGAAGRVAAALSEGGLDELHHGVDQRPRCEVLPGAGFLLVGVFLQKPFVQVTQTFFPWRCTSPACRFR